MKMSEVGEIQGYLAFVADSDLFGWLALLSLFLLATAIFPAARNSRLHRVLTFLVLVTIVAIHGFGSWYGTLRLA
jgi:hypothetical protein